MHNKRSVSVDPVSKKKNQQQYTDPFEAFEAS